MRIGEEIIGNIDEDGYLTCSVEEVASTIDAKVEDVNRVLDRIQHFDPAGVGARDLRECLLLQVEDRLGRDTLPYRIVEQHFEELSTHKYHEIARALGISPQEAQEAADDIAAFDPKPGRKYAPRRKATTSRRISSWRRSTESTS